MTEREERREGRLIGEEKGRFDYEKSRRSFV
jgi:hypothetical protein